jgi:hypothetical protein
MALHYEKWAENANTKEKNSMAHKTPIQFNNNTDLSLQKLP